MNPSVTPDGEVVTVTGETFAQQVLRHPTPVLVDFWAEWCPPCHMIAPILEQIARERAGSLVVSKLNTDENPLIASEYRVMSLPTLMLFRGGQPIQALIGARPKAKLNSELDAALRL